MHQFPINMRGSDTGQMFVELFQLLVRLSNECEAGGEWVIGAPLMELPLSEQIVVLHRLDHSVHTARLWIVQEAKIIAHTWELDVFFLLVKGDIVNCLEELSYLKLADHTNTLSTNSVSVQKCSAKCVDILAKICRVVSLANLHMCFPRSSYWRKGSDVAPVAASLYVEPYFDIYSTEKVLLPVLEVIEDPETSNMILKIMCEAWLDYIYLHRIKFSEYGALQLLTDFAYVSKWVTDCPIISQNVRDQLLKNEVLRRCEGVGRLLLRHPGEAISMRKRLRQLAFELVKNDFSLCLMVQPEGQTSVDHPNPRDWNACQRKCMSPTRNNGWSFVPRKDTIFVAPNNTKTRFNEIAIKFIIKFQYLNLAFAVIRAIRLAVRNHFGESDYWRTTE
ncbi:hypothetical protein E2986_02670 [Frieseomelitta varia]|uniref:Coiled-coil protein 142 C-terminal domain-containing protein n=1 Tax=Frieseomelitta varia TaxID=561572 RepID=A0A833RCX8_9HYME|nr:hypothetical protein E2986_02670 [Frieseomelitta varia]